MHCYLSVQIAIPPRIIEYSILMVPLKVQKFLLELVHQYNNVKIEVIICSLYPPGRVLYHHYDQQHIVRYWAKMRGTFKWWNLMWCNTEILLLTD